MAELKKYLDQAALGTLVDQIKAEDAKVLAAATKAAEDLAKNYDAAGAAATALTDAKAYTDALANGAVKTNTDAIAKLNGNATTEGSVAKAIADAKAAIGEEIDAVDAKADAAHAAADKAQGEVDALETYVGTLPEGTAATSVVDYVNLKTSGIATDAALGELNNQVSGLQTVVNGITSDYLKAADKTELSDAIAAEASRADTAEKANAAAIKAISDDYLKAADKEELQGGIDGVAEDVAEISKDYLKATDKTELQGKIDAKADQTALDAEIDRATKAEANLQTQINTILNNPDAEGAINSINEFTQYITEHGEIADGFRADIDQNKKDIAAEVKRAGEAESALSGRLDTLEAIDHEAYVAADTALKNELTTEIGKKADASVVEAMDTAYKAADTAITGRLDAIEAQLGDGEGSVTDLIADAKQEAIDTAAEDATTKAGQALTDAKAYTDTEVGKDRARLDALEAIEHHTHSNKAELDLIATGDKAKWDEAAGKAHEHGNKTVLDGITAENVASWNTVTSKAAQTALDAAIERIAANEGAIGTLNTTVADKAEQDDLDAAVERIAKNESDIATLTSSLNSFTPITADEVNALFA